MQIYKKTIITLAAISLSNCSISPQPIDAQSRLSTMLSDQTEIYSHQEAISQPLTFYDALARALKYNFDHRLTMMEKVLQDSQLEVATLNMLPRLAIDAGYMGRQSELASSSQSITTRKQSLEASTSQDVHRGVADLAFTWNLLDFGTSYFQAKQQADRILIAQERRRKVINNLVKEVLSAYWSSNIAERLLPQLIPVLTQAEEALKLSKAIGEDRLKPVVGVLEYQRSLLRTIAQLKKLRADLNSAKPKLAGLINVPINSNFALAHPVQTPEAPVLKATPVELENMGLFFRPELREELYQERISRNEVWKELLKAMPGLTIPISANWDSNSFLVHSTWLEASARTTFNLVNLISAPKMWNTAETQVEVAKTRRKALSVAAVVQINIGYQQYLKALDSYLSANELSNIDQSLFKAISNNTEVDAGSELDRIHAATSALASQLEREQSLADVYTALGNIYASIGLDPVTGTIDNITVRALSSQLEKTLNRWYAGDLPKLPEITTPPTQEAIKE
jgi:outer membrane protein TolC